MRHWTNLYILCFKVLVYSVFSCRPKFNCFTYALVPAEEGCSYITLLFNSGLGISWAGLQAAVVSPGIQMSVYQSLTQSPSNLQSSNLAHASHLGGRWKLGLIFFHDSCHQQISAVKSWWNENQLREVEFFYVKIPVVFFVSFVTSC